MQIDINYDFSVDSAPAGFKTGVADAVAFLDSEFTNPITINVDVGYGEIGGVALGTNLLGESEASEYVSESFTSVRNALIAENAPGSSTLPNASPLSGTLFMSQAEAKALGLPQNNLSVDGYVGFSSSPGIFSYADGTAPPSNEYYFIGIVEHEITEDMGRASLLNDQPQDYSAIDLFRYSSAGVRDLTDGGSGNTAYFSINNGNTNLGSWNNDLSNGDLADWYPSGPAPGGNDAFNDYSNPGVINAFSSNDITLMEALGWTVAPTTTYPEISGNVEEWIMSNGQVGAGVGPGSIPGDYEVAAIGNFTGNGTSDILWQSPSTRDVTEWVVSNAAWAGSVDFGTAPAGLQIAGAGNFFGDNAPSDVLWLNPNTGETDLWEMSSGHWAGSANVGTIPGSGWKVAAIGYFTGNGTDDILWQNTGTGDVAEWLIQNGQWAGSVDFGAAPAGLQIAGAGNFFGSNAPSGILWLNPNTGETDIWEMSNGHWDGTINVGTIPGSGWQVAGIGDFTGNGTSDILWHNTNTGDIAEWLIQNGHWAASVDLGHPATGWQIAGVGTLTGNATSDILWHAAT